MRVLDVGPGDEVFVPTLTFVASVNPIRYEGAVPVLVDVEQGSLNMDPGVVAEALERRARLGLRQPKAIEVVHLVGHPADLEALLSTADRHGVPVIEDASEALGASYLGGAFDARRVGSIGRVGCFSFNGNKIITTGGGGMLTTDDASLARRARHLSTQARVPGRAYDHDEIGYNYRLSNLAAALGLAQLERLPELLQARRRVARRYDAAIATIPGILPAARTAWANPSFWLYTARLAHADARERDRVLDVLASHRVDARPLWTPIHLMRLYAEAPRLGGAIAERAFEGAVSLPSSSSLTPQDQERVIGALRSALSAGVAHPPPPRTDVPAE
jgi:dTDP-4-amino-4,6-dideoxygalactose transaminase